MRDPTGIVVKDPNIEVQERLELLFATFLKLGSVAKTMRLFNDRGLDLPRRDHHGDLRWTQATTAAVATMLKNPAYAERSSMDGLACGQHEAKIGSR
jgi:hypothetical protein